MNKRLLQIDISKSKCKSKSEDMIKINLGKEENVEVNFSKLVNLSRYVRDNYKYTEAAKSLQNKFEELEVKYNISKESVKQFIQLFQEERSSVPIENYRDIYTLSEYFCVSAFTSELKRLLSKEIFSDVYFTLQILKDSESFGSSIEMKMIHEIEEFMRGRINEVLNESKFGELSISTIY